MVTDGLDVFTFGPCRYSTGRGLKAFLRLRMRDEIAGRCVVSPICRLSGEGGPI